MLLLGLTSGLACTGTLKSDDAEWGGNGASTGGQIASAGMAGVGTAGGAPNNCGSITPGPSPLVRLSATEYRKTVRDLFPGIDVGTLDLTLPAEVQSSGFLNTAEAQAPSAAAIEAFHNNAAALAKAATSDLQKILPCSAGTTDQEASCGATFVATFGQRALRRPLTAGETARYSSFFEDSRAKWGFQVAVRLVIQAFLQTPGFLYRLEYGGSPEAGTNAVPLNNYEMASRLSYLLTDTMPDPDLMSAAAAGTMGSASGLEAQARRLMQLPGAREAVASFHAQWLRFDKMQNLVKAADLFPSFNAGMAAALKAATERYVDRIFWDEGQTVQALLTDKHAYISAVLAPLYGRSSEDSNLAWTAVDATQRSGILTQAGLMAGLAHERSDAPVQRGVFVLDRLLCQTPPPPLPTVNVSLPPLTAASNQTTRQQLENSHNTPICAACHQSIDGIGFGFENYDAIGQWRTQEFGQNVDASGELVNTDIDGKYNGAVDLGAKLADSRQVRACLASQWLGYALAVRRSELDACAVEPIVKALDAANGDLRELVVALVKSDAFRYRQLEQ